MSPPAPPLTPDRVVSGAGLPWNPMHQLYLDQCGVGQCLGPLVVAAVHAPSTPSPVRDSKRVRSCDWRTLDQGLRTGRMGYRYVEISPQEIDRYNVKTLITSAQRALIQGHAGRIWVDCHLSQPSRLRHELDRPDAVIQHRLDGLHAGVASASLLAYRHRSMWLKALEQRLGCGVGSGNLTDPRTIAYLRAGHQEGLRHKWSLKSL